MISRALAVQFSQALWQYHADEREPGRQIRLEAAIRSLGLSSAAKWLAELLREHASRVVAGGAAKIRLGAGLTPRERQVMRRIGLGETDAEIGKTLAVATKTVSKHVENILKKLGAENRAAAAAAYAH